MKNVNVLVLFFVLCINNIFSQTPPALEWKSITWEDFDIQGNPQTWNQSADEWWYSHKNVYTGTQHTGYVTVGYNALLFNTTTLPFAQTMFSESNTCYDLYTADPPNFAVANCVDLEKLGTKRSEFRGNVALNDLNGKILWNKSLCIGDLQEVIQDGNFIYVVGAHGGSRSFSDPSHPFLKYNPSATNLNDNFDLSSPANSNISCSNTKKTGINHIYVAKLDIVTGAIIWENIYGFQDYNLNNKDALDFACIGYDIIKNSADGKLYVVGQGQTAPFTPILSDPCPLKDPPASALVFKLDPSNGFLDPVAPKVILPISGIPNSIVSGNPFREMAAKSITQVGSGASMAVAATGFYDVSLSCDFTDWHRAFVYNIDQNLNLTGWPVNPISFQSGGGNKRSNIWEIKYHTTKNEILAPVIENCIDCAFIGNNIGDGSLYRIDPASGSTITVSDPGNNPASIGTVHGFDLRFGVEETADQGFVCVSTTYGFPSFTPPTSTELGYLDTQTLTDCNNEAISVGYNWWDTDPVVTKFDANSNFVWQKVFDVIPGRPRQTPPGDLKRQECVYKISQAQDGGFVVSGNCSYNFDDNYLFKIASDCDITQNFDITGPGFITNITGTTLWNTSHKVLSTVRVKPGGVLKIDGSGTIIEFADSRKTGIPTKIYVEIGGRVEVTNGALLTSIQTCPYSMWDGIVLEGSVAKQTQATQGYALLNGGTISNARVGIDLDYNPPSTTTLPLHGGIVQAENFTFLNNRFDVNFDSYHAPLTPLGNEPDNISYFRNSVFTSNKVLNDPTLVDASGNRITTEFHLVTFDVKNININGCTFKTDLTTLGSSFDVDLRSIGIRSYYSTFTAKPLCLVADAITGQCVTYGPANTFENLRYGIHAMSFNSYLSAFRVEQNNFTNCFSGIYQTNCDFTTVDKNNFLINTAFPGSRTCNLNPFVCGKYFYYVNQSKITSHQENNHNVTNSQKVVGIVFNDIGTTNSCQTYRNSYTGLYAGNQSQSNNGPLNIYGGLQIKCNQNANFKLVDIIQSSGNLGRQGICIGGDATRPANNTFSHFSATGFSDVKATTGSGFQYNYNPSPNPPPTTISQVPLYVNALINPNICSSLPPFNYSQHCPTTFAAPCGIPCQQSNASTGRQSANTAQEPLDAGDASDLYEAINGSMSYGNMEQLLLSRSPYLSDGVIIAYLQNPNTPPYGHIKEVVVANSPVTADVIAVINSMNLPNGVMTAINDAQVGTSPRSEQENLVAFYNHEKDLAVNNIITLFLTDSIEHTTDSIIKWLEWNDNIYYKVDLAYAYISVGSFDKARILVNKIKGFPEMVTVAAYLEEYINLYQGGKTWFEMRNDLKLKNRISELASDHTKFGAAAAEAALAIVFGTSTYEVIELIEDGSGARLNNQISANIKSTEDESVITNLINASAFPNPFRDELNVNYVFKEIGFNTTIQLIEIATGRIIQQKKIEDAKGTLRFNTESIGSGMYLISVKENNKPSVYIKVINLK